MDYLEGNFDEGMLNKNDLQPHWHREINVLRIWYQSDQLIKMTLTGWKY